MFHSDIYTLNDTKTQNSIPATFAISLTLAIWPPLRKLLYIGLARGIYNIKKKLMVLVIFMRF